MTTVFADKVADFLEEKGIPFERNATPTPGPEIDKDAKAHVVYPVPSEASLDGEYTPAGELEVIARRLIREHSQRVAAECQIAYLWRDKGGKAKGTPTIGKCAKPSGLLRHFSECDFVIWLAADHLREMGATYQQVEAALWHELAHIGETEEAAEGEEGFVPELTLLPHDLEMFHSEYKLFGAWRGELRAAEHTFRQLPMDLEAAG